MSLSAAEHGFYALEHPALVLTVSAVELIQTWCVSQRLQQPFIPSTAEHLEDFHFILHCFGVQPYLSFVNIEENKTKIH